MTIIIIIRMAKSQSWTTTSAPGSHQQQTTFYGTLER
jgi:hypothetical protein